MNDSTPLSGLAKQLVLNELLDEKTARQAQVQAARNKQSLVSHLVQAKLVQSRASRWPPSSSASPIAT